MRKFIFFAALATALSFSSFVKTKAQGATPFNDQAIIPVTTTQTNPCAGEDVDLSGNIHLGIHGVINKNKISFNGHVNTQGLSGVGQVSGNTYISNSVSSFSSNQNFNGAFETTMIQNAVFTASGKDNNLLAKITIHITINANGEVTAQVVNIIADCK